jgi:hypothetical protein
MTETENTNPIPTRIYSFGTSPPSMVVGICPTCGFWRWLDALPNYADNPMIDCQCGRRADRRAWVTTALAANDRIAWSLASCDFVLWEHFEMSPGDVAMYNLQQHTVAKWLGTQAAPMVGLNRYGLTVSVLDQLIVVALSDSRRWEPPPDPPLVDIPVSWWRFGLQNLNSVPAWRQSLFGASEMIETYPSAALVLIAAGFEAFFIETARIRWNERGLRRSAFKDIAGNQRIAGLVDWLPTLLDMPSLKDDTELYADWKRFVNDRRNDVVHRANVHFTPAQAKESLRCALKAVSYLDESALFRPHVYYAGED